MNPADSVHCPLLYIYNGKTSISKEQNDSIPTLDGQTLSISRFNFENLTQSEGRELLKCLFEVKVSFWGPAFSFIRL